MKRTYTIVLTGTWGSGKSVMALSFVPPEEPAKRLVIDKEARASEYNAKALGMKGDHPESLAFDFDLWPDEYGEFDHNQFLDFVKTLGTTDHNVLVVDNFSMLCDELNGWLQDQKYAREMTKLLGIYPKFANFLETRFKVDPSFHNMYREVVRQIILKAKRADMHVVITAELKNVWQNYGAKGYDSDGKPLQRIVGKTARVPEAVFAMADVIWHLTRNRENVTAKPTVSIDPLSPKCSIVGVPATFTFDGWDKIWEQARKRRLQTDYSGVEKPQVEYIAPEEDETPDPEAMKRQLVATLVEELKLYQSAKDIAETLKALGIRYEIERHGEILQTLIEARTNGTGSPSTD
jgi:hypothetical protein